MGRFLLLLFLCYFLAYQYQSGCVFVGDFSLKKCGWVNRRSGSGIFYAILLIYLILFAGLRGAYNDTESYISMYLATHGNLSALRNIFSAEEPGYAAYSIICKALFGQNYSKFFTFTAFITYTSYIAFFRKYSTDFALSVYLFIATTFFTFTCAALRQCLAIAVAIWAVPAFYSKKWVKGFLLLLIGSSIHKFVFIMAVAVFMKENVWSKTSLLAITATFIAAALFGAFANSLAEITEYNPEYFASGTGMNFFRMLVWAVPPTISLVRKKQINQNADGFGNLCINMSFVGFLFMILALFGGANMFGRTAYYFYPFYVMAFPQVISSGFYEGEKKTVYSLCVLCFFVFYLYSYWGIPFGMDRFNHRSILSLFGAQR